MSKPRKPTINDHLLSHMYSLDEHGHRRGITQQEAWSLYSCAHLSSRMTELKRAGYIIRADTRKDLKGRKYTRYFCEGPRFRPMDLADFREDPVGL